MPLSSPPTPSAIYTNFIALLHPSHSQILELDILPSSFPSTLHSSPPALALPKPLLATLFVTARAEFFAYITPRGPFSPHTVEDGGEGAGAVQGPGEENRGAGSRAIDETDGSSRSCYSYEAALNATRVLLLWDPNHTTAANFRKKHLVSLSPRLSRSHSSLSVSSVPKLQSTFAPAAPTAAFLSLLRSELSFLSSLVTSPLPKAPKASTLWAHRLWLVRSFHADILMLFQQERWEGRGPEGDVGVDEWIVKSAEPNTAEQDTGAAEEKILGRGGEIAGSAHSTLQHLYMTELHIVMRAGERHPRNYYAWGYARALFAFILTIRSSSPNHHIPSSSFSAFPSDSAPKSESESAASTALPLVLSVLRLTHNWCMAHPRDISGWTFLIFLIQKLGSIDVPSGNGSTAETTVGDVDRDGSMQGAARSEVNRILHATKEAAKRFHWRGESVKWFFGAVEKLSLGPERG